MRAHDRVIAAIRAGDAAAARRSMRKHVHAYRERLAAVPTPDELDLEER